LFADVSTTSISLNGVQAFVSLELFPKEQRRD
jgi:hypothetical protein